jgi:transposase
MWFVGIDWADQHHDLAVVDSQGQLFATKRVDHSVDGVGELVAYIRAIATAPEEVACLIETAHGLLITALLEAGLAVYPVHPEMVNRLRPPSGVKTDQLDALLLARTGRNLWPDLHRLRPDSPLVSTLRLLTRDQDDLVAEQTRLINRLIACLKEYYPVVLSCFTSMGQRVALSFLQAYPTVADAQAASRDDLLTLFAQARHAQVEQRVQQVWDRLHAPQFAVAAEVTAAKSRYMQALVAQLVVLKQAIADYDKAIHAVFVQHVDAPIFASLPGAALRLAPRLLAAWGDDRSRFHDARQIQALAGTAPVVVQSGTYRHVRLRRACNKSFRNILALFAGESILREPWAKAYYQRKRQEGKSYGMALRALANQWVRIIFALWQQRVTYQRAIFEQSQRMHAHRAA